jgi:hypothetical protein
VRGLHRAFPPPDPPVYSRPQLKPPCGICLFTTTTFGAHRGADQGAGRNTSGRDLYRLLGGSTSAPPPSTAGLLQLPGLTSTRPGRHTVVPDLHQHLQAGIFFPGPALSFLGPAYICPGRHIYVPADICGPGADFGTSRPAYIFFWPVFLPAGRNKSISAFPGRSSRSLGRCRDVQAWPGPSPRGWVAGSLLPASPPFLQQADPAPTAGHKCRPPQAARPRLGLHPGPMVRQAGFPAG